VIANLVAGWMADRFGAGRVLVLWSVLLGIAFWTFYAGALAGAYSPALYVIAGFGVGVTALVPAIAVSGFPAQVRFSGLSFSYNVAYAIAGGLTPVAAQHGDEGQPRRADPLHRSRCRCWASASGLHV
jgi:MFS family permease